jgi:hypothetical protein
LRPELLRKRVDRHTARSYAELYPRLRAGSLLEGGHVDDLHASWAREWDAADPDRFHPIPAHTDDTVVPVAGA